MVSRRNFISITSMMLVLLVIFQATQLYYERFGNIDVNEYFQENVKSGTAAWKQAEIDVTDPALTEQYVLFIGDEDGAVNHTVKQWCNYTKRNLVVCEDLDSFHGNIGRNQEYVLVESAHLDLHNDVSKLIEFAEAGVSIVFCDLPSARDVSENAQLQKLLGIRKVRAENVAVTGLKMFSGFFVGGEFSYQVEDETPDQKLEIPWYQLAAGAQTYMIGLLDDQQMKDEGISREMLPAVLWSYTNGNVKVFAVNGDYLHDNTGVGMLAAIDAKLNYYSLYPILDAQVLTVANYAGFAEENTAVLQQIFSNNMLQVGRDVVFPQLFATMEQSGFTMSCMLQLQYDYLDTKEPQTEAYRTFLKLMKGAGAEMGLSLGSKGNTTLAEKLAADKRFFAKTNSQYAIGSVYTSKYSFRDIIGTGLLPDSVRTIVSAHNARQDLIAFGNEEITVQTVTNDASVYTFASDLYMRSVQTALGYTNVQIDLNRVFWPAKNEISWERLSKKIGDNLYTGWRKFQDFEDATVSQNDQKIRQLLTMDYNHTCVDNVIHLELENTNQSVSFILRLQNIKSAYVEGGTCTMLEDGAYLIRTDAKNVDIHIVDSNTMNDN